MVTNSVSDAVFWMGFALLTAHELDAVRAREWRLLFVLRHMPEARAQRIFIVAHAPLLWMLIILFTSPAPLLAAWSRALFDMFLVIHVVIHHRLERHPDNDFRNPVSRTLIYSSGVAGFGHLAISLPTLLG